MAIMMEPSTKKKRKFLRNNPRNSYSPRKTKYQICSWGKVCNLSRPEIVDMLNSQFPMNLSWSFITQSQMRAIIVVQVYALFNHLFGHYK